MSEPDLTGLPKPPTEPDDAECCHRGCVPCIFDYYDGALERWRRRIELLGRDPDAVLARFREIASQERQG
jgi:hypothetical protein